MGASRAAADAGVDAVDAAISRLRLIPGNLEDGKRNLRSEMVPNIFLDRAANQARAGALRCSSVAASSAQVEDPELAGRLAEAGDATASAYESYVAFLEEMRPDATGEWALGEDRYSALLREKELLGFDARELRERGRSAYDELASELKVSKGSVSTNARLLEQRGILERICRPADRRDYYRVPPDLFTHAMAQRLARWQRFHEAIGAARTSLPIRSQEVLERLEEELAPIHERMREAVASAAGPADRVHALVAITFPSPSKNRAFFRLNAAVARAIDVAPATASPHVFRSSASYSFAVPVNATASSP